MRTFVLGNDNCVLGFALVHVDGRWVRSREELDKALDLYMADKSIGMLLISGDVADWCRERIDKLKVSSLTPLVVEVPGERTHTTFPALGDFVQRAVGIRLGGS
jgi:vacuolar-type H+-ATPase subunit F/Vma7